LEISPCGSLETPAFGNSDALLRPSEVPSGACLDFNEYNRITILRHDIYLSLRCAPIPDADAIAL